MILNTVVEKMWQLLCSVPYRTIGVYVNRLSSNGRSCLSHWPRGLRTLACWYCGFESHRGYGFLSVVSVMCCQVEVSAIELITRPEESYRLCCVVVCVIETSSIEEPNINQLWLNLRDLFAGGNLITLLSLQVTLPASTLAYRVLVLWFIHSSNILSNDR